MGYAGLSSRATRIRGSGVASGPKVIVAVLSVGLLLAASGIAQGAPAAETTLVSVHTDGTQGDNVSSFASISAGGRYVAFTSAASTLVTGDTNNRLDVFVRGAGRTNGTGVYEDASLRSVLRLDQLGTSALGFEVRRMGGETWAFWGLRGFAQRSRYFVFTHGHRQTIAETALTYAEVHGIEVRHPFHDARLTRFMMGASGNHMRLQANRKVLLREAMRGTLPEMVRTRTSKAMFINHSIDAHEALLNARPMEEMLPVKLGWIDGKRVAGLHDTFSKWRRGGSQEPVPYIPLGPIWFTLAIDLWLRHAFRF